MHLAGNLLYLWIFGSALEAALGRLRVVVFYVACGLASALVQLASDPSGYVPTVGASGPVSGLLGAWWVAALFQPLNSLSFVTDGIHWGTADYRFLRNAVAAATATGAALLVVLQGHPGFSLTHVWLITGAWIAVRAGFGVTRIWPGFGAAPLRRD